MLNPVAIFLLAMLSAWLLTGAVLRYAQRALLDMPGERSSHQVPTPRGGGVSIVLVVLVGSVMSQSLADPWVTALLGAGGTVALVGFIDDHRHVPARWRLATHIVAAAAAIYWLGGPPGISALGVEISGGFWLWLPAIVFVVWMLNLYNFMDGIDGLAALQALTLSLGINAVLLIAGLPVSAPMLLIAGAAAGFLIWNFPPARIFMGDVGSGFLGVVFAITALFHTAIDPELFWCWLILMAVFVTDASWTLVRRFQRGEAVFQAHRSHAYQRAARALENHGYVSVAVALINLVWLLSLALLVASGRLDGLIGAIIAYSPLLWLVYRLGGGLPDQVPVSLKR
ncbi:MraY family glycosyltransferase [Marinobacterium litorale]|uniref:MraY family glycosyltransferase n=1 Tax=Marinobacterium litorale TaxID=404770 RepID=UPI0004248D00|nr:glycosyltransferase family 4 protein [Marinobacterium litorale]